MPFGQFVARALRFVLAFVLLWACAAPAQAKDDPIVGMAVTPASSVFGTPITLNAVIRSPTSAGPAPTGTLSFARRDPDNSNHPICKVTIDTNSASQSCSYPAGYYPAAGTSHFVALYSGDANYNGNLADGFAYVDYVVTKQTPTVALDPPAPVFVGQYAALYLHIGNATLTDGIFGAAIGGANGDCSIPGPGITCFAGKTRFGGTFDVYASFAGDANHNAVPNAVVGQISLLPAPTTLTIGAPSPIALGDSVTISFKLASLVDPAARFSGDISLTDGEVSCPARLLAAAPGDLSCTLTPVSAGVRHLIASYGGSSEAAASTGSADLTVLGPKIAGTCGSDNGKTLSVPPVNLCIAGTPTAVVGSGPWNWSCVGSNGGATANCSADVAMSTSYTITATVNPSGAGTVTCAPNPVASGGTSTCTASVNAGYAFVSFSGDCSGATCTLSNVTANKSVVANFTAAQRPGTISVRGIGNGDTTPSTADGTDFGSTPVGVPVTHAFTIDNLGAREASLPPGAQAPAGGQAVPQADGDLIVSSITSSNPAFAVSGGTGTIAVNANATFDVHFNASVAGAQTATITIASNDGHTPSYTFAVSAVAVATTPGGVRAAPTLSSRLLGVLSGLLCIIGVTRISRRMGAGPRPWRR